MTGNDLYQLQVFMVMTGGWFMALFTGQSFLHVVTSGKKNILKLLKSGKKNILKVVKSGKKHLQIGET